MSRTRLLLISSMISVILPFPSFSQELNFQKVVRTGDEVPDQPGRMFTTVGSHEFVEGRVLVLGDFDCSGCEGIYLYENGIGRKVADTDTLLPDSVEDFRNFLSISALSETHVFFDGAYGFGTGQQFFFAPLGSLILEEANPKENPIPGGTGTFQGISETGGALSGTNLAFVAEGENDQKGVYQVEITTNVATKIADRNDTIPGDNLGRKFLDFGTAQIEGERVLFFGGISNGPLVDQLKGLYLFENDSLFRVMDEYMLRPGSASRIFGDPRVPRLSEGLVYFNASTSIYVWDAGIIELIVERGMEIPGSTALFDGPNLLFVSEGTVLFFDRPSGGGTTTYYLARDGAIVELYSGIPQVDGMTPTSVFPVGMSGSEVLFRVNFGGSDGGSYVADVSEFVGIPPDPTSTPTPIPELDPDLTVQMNLLDDFFITTETPTDLVCGNRGFFKVVVTNLGEGPTTGLITVVVQYPDGLINPDFLDQGEGWTGTIAGQIVTCTRSDPLGTELPFSTEFLSSAMVTEDAPSIIQPDVSVSTVGDSNLANNSSFLSLTVGQPPVDVILISPKEGDLVPSGSRPTIAFKLIGPDPDYPLKYYRHDWNGGSEYKGSGLSFREYPVGAGRRQSQAYPEIPFGIEDNRPIQLGFVLSDFFNIFSKRVSVTVNVKKLPGPPTIEFLTPDQRSEYSLNESSRIEIQSLLTICADYGLNDPFAFEIKNTSGTINDPGFIQYDFVPYILGRNGDGRISKMNLYLMVSFTEENYNELFMGEDPQNVFLEVAVRDIKGNESTQNLFLTIRREPTKESSEWTPGKGINTLNDKSRIIDGSVTGSTLEKSLIFGATVENSVIRSSILLPGIQASNAEIDFGVVLSGTVSKGGTTLVPPALLSDLYEPGESGHVLATVLTGDANDDGVVEAGDRLGISTGWYDRAEAFDLNLNEEVDPSDLLNLIEFWRAE